MPCPVKFAALALSIALPVRAHAQTIQGTLFEDVNRNGVRDFGEPALSGVPVTLFGDGGAVDVQTASAADGTWSFSVASGLEFVLDVQPGPDWRESFQDLGADADPIPDWPQGRRRPGASGFLVGNLRAATTSAPLLHVALGDSIAYGFNLCDSTSGQNDYVTPLTDRLGRASAKATLTKLAVLGQETKDLLAASGTGTIHDAISAGAQLVSISIGGNDYLNDDGNTALTAANLVGARQNLQEILSTLESELPASDVVLNTVYDNKGGGNAFHNTWGPIWDQALRDVAWGQVRRVCIAEIFPDYAHLDPGTNTVLGEKGLICSFFGLDGIHPKARGYDLHEQKVWQGIGGVESSATTETRDFGWIRRIDSRLPTVATDLVGGATNLADALAQDDVGATIPGGNSEVRLSGFDATPNGKLEQVVVHVRYRTSAPPTDDVYRFEASVDGTFSAPGADSASWNTIVPIVGSSGIGAPVLARPDQPNWRDVTALVTKGTPVDGSPSLTWQDLASLTVRVRGSAVGSADAFNIEWDVASIDLYGVPPYTLLPSGTAQIGGTLALEATGRQGDDTWLFLSSGPGNLPFHPWGTLGVDLSHFLLLNTGSVGADGTSTIGGAIPNDPALIGISVWCQTLVVQDYALKIGALTNTVEVTFE
jgi:lysophospholipase L1-like esterase